MIAFSGVSGRYFFERRRFGTAMSGLKSVFIHWSLLALHLDEWPAHRRAF